MEAPTVTRMYVLKAFSFIPQSTKEDLVQARKIRRNRMEYDALAKVICKNPDRETLGNKLEEIKAEIERLKKAEDALDEKLEMRKKHFHVMINSIHQLQVNFVEVHALDFGLDFVVPLSTDPPGQGQQRGLRGIGLVKGGKLRKQERSVARGGNGDKLRNEIIFCTHPNFSK